jgi:hypothetical protein
VRTRAEWSGITGEEIETGLSVALWGGPWLPGSGRHSSSTCAGGLARCDGGYTGDLWEDGAQGGFVAGRLVPNRSPPKLGSNTATLPCRRIATVSWRGSSSERRHGAQQPGWESTDEAPWFVTVHEPVERRCPNPAWLAGRRESLCRALAAPAHMSISVVRRLRRCGSVHLVVACDQPAHRVRRCRTL